MADKYALNVDIVMLVMSSVLVLSSSLNEKIYNSAASFKAKTGSTKQASSAATLGMTPDAVEKFSNVVAVLGAAAAGSYGLNIVYKKKGSVGSPQSPKVYTAVFGFAVSLALILSGVVSHGLYKQVSSFKNEKEKGAKMSRDVNTSVIVLGAVSLVLLLVMVAKKARPQAFQFRSPLAGGGRATSTFFTY